MAGGGIPVNKNGKKYPGKLTSKVFWTCIIAATGGLIFGYDLGISGGVTSMDSFLKQFFPDVYAKESVAKPSDDQYCKFDSQKLTLFTSSLYLAALFSSMVAATVTRKFGRRTTMLNGGIMFLLGAIFNAAAVKVWMLYVGRALLGFGIGFANQSVPIFVSEMAPYKFRGMLNMTFQLCITIGILVANYLNYRFSQIAGGWGWRLSLGGAVVPALIIIFGSLSLSDTPNSLIERGHLTEAKRLLLKIRGVENVDEEFDDIVAASEASRQVKHPWRTILSKRCRPHLTFAVMIPLFQQLTGMNVFIFYAPVLFKTMGFGANGALYAALITSVVNAIATLLAVFLVDKMGRRFFFLLGGTQMFICQVIMTTEIAKKYGLSGNPGELSKQFSLTVVIVMCTYIAGFAYSWGPLGWLVPSEIFPLEVRSAAQSINVSTNMIFTFAIAQVFTSMLCHLKFGLFIFFSCCVVVMTVFIFFLFPETKGVPIEEMNIVWKNHKYWKKYIPEDVQRAEVYEEIDFEKAFD